MKAYYFGFVSGLSCLAMAMGMGGKAAIAETQAKFSDTLTQNVTSVSQLSDVKPTDWLLPLYNL